MATKSSRCAAVQRTMSRAHRRSVTSRPGGLGTSGDACAPATGPDSAAAKPSPWKSSGFIGDVGGCRVERRFTFLSVLFLLRTSVQKEEKPYIYRSKPDIGLRAMPR
jgi:hypothetical protein